MLWPCRPVAVRAAAANRFLVLRQANRAAVEHPAPPALRQALATIDRRVDG